MIAFVDTSVVLRILFGQPKALSEWGRWQVAYASELLGVEARRAIDRLRLELFLDDAGVAAAQEQLTAIERTLGCVRLTRTVLRRAAMPMPTVLKTLAALHLASALLLYEQRGFALTFATHDRPQALAARSLGFSVIGESQLT